MKFREKMESFGIDAIVNVKDMDRARKLLADAGMPVEKLSSEITEEQAGILDASFSKAKAKKTIDTIMRRSGFLIPHHSEAFYQLLKSNGILRI